MQDRIFYAVCFGFVIGVLLRSFVAINFFAILFLSILAIALIFLFLIFKNKWGIVIGIFLLFISLGILRFHLADKKIPEISGENLTGIVVDEPNIRENNQKLTVKIAKHVKVLITTNFNEEYKYGDRINFEGKLQKPENFITDQGKEFDYVSYLRKDGIFYVMGYPKIEIISHGNGSKIRSALFSVKEKLLEKMNLAIAPPESLLMGVFVLGERSAFNQGLRQAMVNTGTIHIVALSGYNVTIVAEWLMKLFFFLPPNLGIGAGVFAILLFVLMTGGTSTAVRAGIMATLALIARATGRSYDMGRALLLAGIFMILLNPFVLVYDVSFQLSFIPFTMGLGFFTSFLGLLWYPLSVPLGFISYLFLKYELAVISFFSQLPFAAFTIPNFPLVLTLLIYTWFVYKLFGRDIKNFFAASVELPESSVRS